MHFDVIVIGSGSAGNGVAHAVRKRGKTVAIIDKLPFGGTCALRGCDPKKVLVYAASVFDAAQRMHALGILDCAPRLEWPELMRFKRTFTDPVPEERRRSYAEAGIVALEGQAAFEDEATITVNGERLHAEHIVIASGAKPEHVAKGDELLLTSDGFLELAELPKSLIFVGGGYIAFEFAHVAARAGARVTIVHSDDAPLHEFDRDLVGKLLEATREAGVAIELEAPVKSVARDGGEITVTAKRGARSVAFRAESGVLAAGRVPDIDDLQLDRCGVERTEHGVKVDATLRSVSNSHVYACGDAADTGASPLTPAAGYGAEIVAANLLNGANRETDFNGLATMVYTIPPLGSVGITEGRAKDAGIEYECHEGDMREWYSTRHVGGGVACYKVLIEKNSGKILGASVLGPHAEEQINVFALAIRQSLKADAIKETLFAYPTGSSDLEYMIE